MAQSKYTELTDAIYRLLEFFPEQELLRQKTKEKALQILENLVLVCLPDGSNQKGRIALQSIKDIEVLKSYLDLAKSRGWVESINLLIVFKEYDKIKEELRPIAELAQKGIIKEESDLGFKKNKQITPVDNIVNIPTRIVNLEGVLTARQDKILEILNTQEKAQVADFQKALTSVTKRTIRRDLDDLLRKGKVNRIGEFNQVFYKINKEVLPVAAELENRQDPSQKAVFEA